MIFHVCVFVNAFNAFVFNLYVRLWTWGLVEECLSLQSKVEEAENKEWELEYLKGKVKNLEANFGAMVNVAFPAGGETWFDGYRKGFKDAHNDLVAQGAAAINQESETVVKNEKEPGGDSEYEEIEVEDSPGYASTAVPGEDDSESELGCWF